MIMSFAVGCTNKEAKQETIKIGVIAPLTKTEATDGMLIFEGLEVANQMQTEILGKSVELVIADSKNNANDATAAAKRLIETDNVVAIIGSWDPAVVNIENKDIPIINMSTTTQTKAFDTTTATTDAQKAIVDGYKNKYPNKTEIPALTVISYDSYRMLMNAITEAKSTKPNAIKKALTKDSTFEGVTNTLNANDNGNLVVN